MREKHSGDVDSLACSRDSEKLIFVLQRLCRHHPGHQPGARHKHGAVCKDTEIGSGVAQFPDKRLVAIVSDDKTVVIWGR